MASVPDLLRSLIGSLLPSLPAYHQLDDGRTGAAASGGQAGSGTNGKVP